MSTKTPKANPRSLTWWSNKSEDDQIWIMMKASYEKRHPKNLRSLDIEDLWIREKGLFYVRINKDVKPPHWTSNYRNERFLVKECECVQELEGRGLPDETRIGEYYIVMEPDDYGKSICKKHCSRLEEISQVE